MMTTNKSVLIRAKAFENDGYPDKALELLTQAIEAQPNAELFYERGFVYEGQFDYENALMNYDSAIAIAELPKYLVARGRVLARSPSCARPSSETDYINALEKDPTNIHAMMHLCLWYRCNGNSDAAMELARKVVNLAPSDAKAHSCLGECFFNESRFNSSTKEFREATRLDPNDAACWWFLGRSLESIDLLSEAVQSFRKAVELERSSTHLLALACALISIESYQDAIDIFDSMVAESLSESESALVNGYKQLAKSKLDGG
jgi:tetratricopeptide (TPR) repeat protein